MKASPKGSKEALFAALYKRHAKKVFSSLHFFGVRDKEEIKDVAQNAWTRVFRQLDSFRGENERAWVAAAARAAWLDWRRTRRRRPENQVHADPETLADARTPEAITGAREQGRVLGRLLEKAIPNEEQREVWVLSDVLGLTASEIAEETGASVTTVQGRLRMARTKLDELLAPEEREELRSVLPVLSVAAFTEALRNSASPEDVAEVWRRVAEATGVDPNALDDAPSDASGTEEPPPDGPRSEPPVSKPAAPTGPAPGLLAGRPIGFTGVGLFVGGAIVGALLVPRSAPPPPTPLAPISIEKPGIAAPREESTQQERAVAPATSVTSAALATSRTAPPAAPQNLPSAWDSRALLSRARGEIAQTPAEALALTELHARRFPTQGATLRELIAIQALAKLGRTAEAEARGRQLLARAPDMAPRLRILFGPNFF